MLRLKIRNHRSLALFAVISLVFLSCKKENKEKDDVVPAQGEAAISFQISGVQDVEEVTGASENKASTSLSRNRQAKFVQVQSEIVNLDGLDAIMTVSEELPAQYPGKLNEGIKPLKNNSSIKSSDGEKNARVIGQLPAGRRYRIVLYTANANGDPLAYIGEGEGIVGSNSVSIGGLRNTKYRWYAYTYNNNSPIPEFTASGNNVPVNPSANSNAARQDFAYSTGIITTGNEIGGTYSINNIVLTRKTARIIVEVNSRGMFGAINYASPRFKDNSGLIKANFKLTDSSYNNISTSIGANNVYNHHSSGYSVPVGVDTVPKPDWKRRYTFYSPTDGKTARTFNISLDTLRIVSERLEDANGAPGQRTRSFYGTTFSFPAFVPLPGKSYFISIKLVESPIRIGSTSWARGNVFRHIDVPATPDGKWQYMFRYDNPYYQTTAGVPYTDYFQNDIYDIGGKNICERIYPEGTWDLPTQADFQALGNTLRANNIIEQNYGWYVSITPSITAPSAPGYPNGNLVFVPVGYKVNTNSSITNFYPNSISYRNTKGYWRTKAEGTFARFNLPFIFGDYIDFTNLTSTYQASIRCIRKK